MNINKGIFPIILRGGNNFNDNHSSIDKHEVFSQRGFSKSIKRED